MRMMPKTVQALEKLIGVRTGKYVGDGSQESVDMLHAIAGGGVRALVEALEIAHQNGARQTAGRLRDWAEQAEIDAAMLAKFTVGQLALAGTDGERDGEELVADAREVGGE